MTVDMSEVFAGQRWLHEAALEARFRGHTGVGRLELVLTPVLSLTAVHLEG